MLPVGLRVLEGASNLRILSLAEMLTSSSGEVPFGSLICGVLPLVPFGMVEGMLGGGVSSRTGSPMVLAAKK